MEPTSAILSGVSIANIVVLGILICTFGKMYAKTKAHGLLIFLKITLD
jgi:hypothetical protein